MQPNKKRLLITLLTIASAVGSLFLFLCIFQNQLSVKDSENSSIAKRTTASDNLKLSLTAKAAESIPVWKKDGIYLKGDRVTYNGKQYSARWWTQGETPDLSKEWGVWELIKSSPIKKSDNTKKNIAKDKKTSASNKNKAANKTSKAKKTNFKIVGYYPDWQPKKADSIDYSKLTHINYAFAIPKSDGTIRKFENPYLAKKIIKNAHKKKVKVLLAVGGWSYKGDILEPTFVEATATAAKRKKLANNLLKLVDSYGFDGIDMDWEHPRKNKKSQKQYEALMKELHTGLKKRKKLLTSAVLAGVSSDGSILADAGAHTSNVIKYVDWLNVMAYDGGDGPRHSPYSYAVKSANYWLKTRKVPKQKVVLGVPFYARPSWAPYNNLLKADPMAAFKDTLNYNGVKAYYNGLKTIRKKTEWSKKNAGGIMIWELSQDTTDPKKSLLNQIYKASKGK